jgi:hypothetical protein
MFFGAINTTVLAGASTAKGIEPELMYLWAKTKRA